MVVFPIRVVADSVAASKRLGRIENQLGRLEAGAGSLKASLDKAFKITSVVVLLRQLQQLTDTFISFQNRLRITSRGTENLSAVIGELFKISEQTRSSFEGTATVYSRLALSANELGTSQQELLDFTKAVNQAVILSGATAEEARGGLIQFSQGLASGTLRGDELRSVLEQLPKVADVIAKGLGIARGELRTLGREGKITSDIILEAFRKQAGVLEQEFQTTIPTVGQAFQVLGNTVLQVVGQINEVTGASESVARAIISLSGKIKSFAASGLRVLIDNVDVIIRAVKTLVILLGPSVLIKAIRALTAVIATNPLGLLLVAISTLIALVPDLQSAFDAVLQKLSELADFIFESLDFHALFTTLASNIDGIIATFNGLLTALGVIFDSIGEKPEEVGQLLKKGFRDAIEAILDYFFAFEQTVGNILIGVGQDAIDVTQNVGGVIGAISVGKVGAAEAFAENIKSALLRSANRVATFTGQFEQNLRKLRDAELLPTVELSDSAKDLGNKVANEFRRGVEESRPAASDALAALLGPGDGLFAAAQGLAQQVSEGFLGELGISGATGGGLDIKPPTQFKKNPKLSSGSGLFFEAQPSVDELIRLQKETEALKLKGLDASDAFGDGFTRAFIRIGQEARNFAQIAEDIVNIFTDKLVDTLNELTDTIIELSQQGKLTFESFTHEVEDAFKSFADQILRELQRILIRLIIVQALSALSPSGSTAANLGAGLGGARQEGGPVAAGRTYLVGEDGPELFTPKGAGNITPNSALTAAPAAAPEVNVQIVNVDDKDMIPSALNSGDPKIDAAFVNLYSRNRDKIAQVS